MAFTQQTVSCTFDLSVRKLQTKPERPADCTGGPIVLPDMSDNPGGGGTSDGVVVLHELLVRNVQNCVVATIVDPDVVQSARNAGVCVFVTSAVP